MAGPGGSVMGEFLTRQHSPTVNSVVFGASCLGSSPFTGCVPLGRFLNLWLLTCRMGL